ncbi:MAG: AmmeMemoRadiSam system protein B [Verrucomicrobiae bacterium]|nr:AmmeMemoRadiSam system protein B [Verrucomicrobiae bacterium]
MPERASPLRPPRRTRPAAVAGWFYPNDPTELRRTIEGFLRYVKPASTSTPKAVIAPHAGYVYSGPVAASAYARFIPARNVIKRVVLLGPSHCVAFRGLAASSAEAWTTPLGTVRVDTPAVHQVTMLPPVSIRDEAHDREHSLEVHLPFLQVVLGEFKIVPLVVGKAEDEEVFQVIETLWGGDTTRFVISSDLSHYHDYVTARTLDAATARAIERLRPEEIGREQACGRVPLRGLLRAAKAHGLRVETIDLRNSGDTAGPRAEVVGYGAWAFHEAAA